MKKAIFSVLLFLAAFQNLRAQSPGVGVYPATTIAAAGGNATIMPLSPPVNVISAAAYCTTGNFKGLLQVNTATGVVTVTNAQPAGTYMITVLVFNGISTAIRNFTLTVNNANCSQGLFTGNVTIPVGSLPYSVVTGDFNADGKQDIATANYSNSTISIRLGDGAGGFSGPLNINVGANPQALAVGDFNGDGKQDIAVANFVGNSVSILLGNGAGGFSVTGNLALGSGTFPYSIIITDFNGDGKADFATANYGTNNVSIRLGDGAGNFSGTTLVPVGTGPRLLVTGDFNNDGKTDIATANYGSNTVSIRLGDGAGNFSGTNNLPVGANPHSITVGDFNGDGKLDLATANFGNSSVSVRMGDGFGNFSGATELIVGTNPRSIATGDFNGDGKQDLVIANSSNNNVSIRLGDGSGNFNGGTDMAVGNDPYSVAVGDFNGDGKEDIALANTGNASVSIRLGTANDINVQGNNTSIADGDTTPAATDNTDFGNVTGNLTHVFTIQNTGIVNLQINNITISGSDAALFVAGGISLPLTIPPGGAAGLTVSFIPTSGGLKTATININNDNCEKGVYDFAVQGMGIALLPVLGSYASTAITTGGNTVVTASTSPANTQNITAYASGNFGGLLQVDATTGAVTITNARPAGIYNITVKANGVSTAASSFILTVNNTSCSQGLFTATGNTGVGNNPYSAAIGDFNGDGKQDIATANYGNNTVSIRLGDGSGNFTGITNIPVGTNPQAIAIGDFNGDGKEDLAVANAGSASISVCLGDGSGGFTVTGNISTGAIPLAITIADFNNDGKQDIAIANYGSNTVSIRFGDGLGGFSGSVNVLTGTNPRSVIAGDFNGDGKTDLATADYGSNTVSIYLGDGLGAFSPANSIAVGANPYSLAIGDFNGDGKPDLATADYGNDSISVLLGDGSGNFRDTTAVHVGSGTVSIATGDFNGDGKQDIATANSNNNSVSIRLGNGSGTFKNITDIVVGNSPWSLAVGDFNNDGKADIVTANKGSADISIRLGNVNNINVQGNNNNIADGSNTTSVTDGTDFGNVASTGIHSFTIQNTGAVNLLISSITITGNDSSLFNIGSISLPLGIAAGGSATFAVSFVPTSAGLKTATVNINNDNCDKAVYDFAVQGIGAGLLPVLGVYPATTISSAGGNATVTPSAVPVNAQNITAFTSGNFKGLLQVDIVTGVVSITNAHPAGTYNIVVKSNGLSTTVSSFILTVNNTSCSQGLFTGAGNVPVANNPYSVAVGDFNLDGKQDIATANYGNNSVSIRLGNGSGGFTGITNVSVGNNPYSIAIGDFNGDGKQDIATANYSGSTVSIRLGDGSGNFSGNTEVFVGIHPTLVIVSDFNGDGKQDIGVVINGTNTIAIRLGDGAGNFSGTTSLVAAGSLFSAVVGDFNADGKQDIAIANYNVSTVTVYLGDGQGGFNAAAEMSVGISPYSIITGDFNGDGKQDLATANYGGNTVSIRLGDGAGNFSGTTEVPVGSGPGSIAIGDFNGDGRQDIVTTNYLGNSLSIRLGNGSGDFSGTTNMIVGVGPESVAVGDFNADGKQDLAVANNNNNNVSIRLGTDKEINIQGNNISIVSGDSTPDASDNTDFGTANFVTHTFSIQNTGTGNLTVSSINSSGPDASSFTVSGISLPASIAGGTAINFTVTFLPTRVGQKTATIHITNDDCDEGDYHFAVTGTFACPVVAVSFTGLSAAYCSNASAVTLTGSQASGVVFSGSGITDNGNGTAIFNPAAAGAGQHIIGYVYTDGYGCTHSTAQTTTVNPLPVVSFSGLSASYCINAPAISLNGNQAPGGIFTGAGITANINGTAVFDPLTAGVGAHTIGYAYTDANGCTNSMARNVTINALPFVSFSGLSVSYCINASAVTLTGNHETGSVFTGPGITNTGNGTAVFDPATAGAGLHTIGYAYTDINGCTNNTSQIVTVNALPVVGFAGLANSYCIDAFPATLTGLPAGGTFSGPGINGNIFTPAMAGTGGPYTITYSYTDPNGCTNTQSQAVTVHALPVVSFSGLALNYLVNSAAVMLTGNPLPNGIFTGPGITANGNGTAIFDPATAGVGIHNITYFYADMNGCSNASTQQVSVINAITVNMKLFLQGYYTGNSSMQPVLNNEGVPFSPQSETDTITVELHDPETFILIDTKEAVLQITGIVSVTFVQPPGLYYIAIKHRNTIQTWSADPVMCTGATALYNFTTAAAKAFGNNEIEVEPGIWAFYTGDINQDEFIDGNDFPDFDNDSFNGVSGEYKATDMNGDGFVDGNDFPVYDVNSFKGVSSIHP